MLVHRFPILINFNKKRSEVFNWKYFKAVGWRGTKDNKGIHNFIKKSSVVQTRTALAWKKSDENLVTIFSHYMFHISRAHKIFQKKKNVQGKFTMTRFILSLHGFSYPCPLLKVFQKEPKLYVICDKSVFC